MINPPCKNCETRTIGCHAGCERYKAFQKQQEEKRKLVEAAFKTECMFREVERPHCRIWTSQKRQRNDLTRNRTK